MKGLLVCNHFIDKSIVNRFNALYEMFKNAFSKRGCKLDIITNKSLKVVLKESNNLDYDFVLFWDKDIYLCRHLENLGFKVFNSSKAIEICDDKAKTFLELEKYDILMPKTILAPFKFSNNQYDDYSFVNEAIEELKLPMIIKENFGSFGNEVYLVNTLEEAIEKIKMINSSQFLFQEFIESSYSKDIRVLCTKEKYVGCVKRTSNDFRSNVLQGGKMEIYNDLDPKYQDLAVKICNLLGLDFTSVDFLIGKDNILYLCEVNSNVHFKTFYKTTNIDFSEEICEYILSHLNQ